MIDEHWGAFTCWTSTLAVFVISDPFNGLLLNVLWSQTISMVVKPQYVLTCCRQDSQFGPILARFLDYYSLFWGPRVISTINEPRGAFTYRSLTLTVLTDSGPFHGLLLNVLGPRRDFHD